MSMTSVLEKGSSETVVGEGKHMLTKLFIRGKR